VWFRGRAAVALVDAAVPAELCVPLGTRPVEAVPHVPVRRRVKRLVTAPATLAVLAMLVLGVTLVAARQVSDGRPFFAPGFFVLLFAVSGLLRSRDAP